jgi:hypothetical protein
VHHVFTVLRWKGGEPCNVCDKHSKIQWFDIEELSQLSNLEHRTFM